MFFGSGVLKGLGVTIKNFFNSFSKSADDGGIFTAQYPEQPLPTKERFRNIPFLIFDDQPENLRCVACDICAKECPPKCIYIVRAEEDGKPLKKPAVFDIDATVCMNCGICEEACPFDAIFMDNDYEIAHHDRQGHLLLDKDALLKSNEYFHKIRPTDATAIDAKIKEAEEKKKAADEARKKAVAAKAAAQAAEKEKEAEAPKPPETEGEKDS